MTTLEMVKFTESASPAEQANVSDIVGVGKGAINEKNEVMLVQALCKLIGHNEKMARRYIGLGLTDLPEPTGVFDHKTIQAIWGFQRRNAHKLLSVDGKIHPGNYKNRVIQGGRVMTITLLNGLALDGALYNHNTTDVISAIRQVAPHLILTRGHPQTHHTWTK